MPEPLESGPPGRAKWWRRRPPTGITGAVFWLALWFGVLWLFRQVPTGGGSLLGWMQVLVGIALISLAVPMTWRLVRQRLLWSLRNKLILTYLLIGLAPVVLFLTLVMISAYIAAGQFSIHLAATRMRQQLEELGTDNSVRASRVSRFFRDRGDTQAGPAGRGHGGPGDSAPPADLINQASEQTTENAYNRLLARLHRHSAVYLNGAPMVPGQTPGQTSAGTTSPIAGQETTTGQPTMPLGLPIWAADLHGNQFRGLVLDGENLFLVAIDQRHVDGRGLLTVISSLPVDAALMDVVANGLGRVGLSGSKTGSARATPTPSSSAPARNGQRTLGTELQRTSVFGGTEPTAANFCDLRVPFVSTMDITDWDAGPNHPDNVPIEVYSRPSLLYRQLFGSSIGGIVTSFYLYGLVALCILFGLIEALALLMALRLSRAITASVEGLYSATQRVDRGDFMHRIPALYSGEKDQLGELARSFNSMTGPLERLMIEQQEKERLQSELTIAQEVQANLFPRNVHDLPTLELHGICRPARSVSGDYYDFLVFHHPHGPKAGKESGVGIAIGDISGKGISAALLMATLHSAVRAYRLAGEDLVYSESIVGALTASREGLAGDGGKIFESPGSILALLNRHLYRSTQPSKYATLFLAHYDAATSQLTYSNAGHLPPLVVSRDGKVRRLDCGGTVVGLMDGMRYEEDRFQMKAGDILVGYSDGITEPENDFGEFGEERLMEVVARYRDHPLHVISAQVMLALDAWIGAEEQPDDITLVLARQL